ncbi:MAG: FRG domain-containing protein [Deltaproteobacteria bacterium]|nr:FRG domain-containing protein [Deltaproteobacteria bacterium]
MTPEEVVQAVLKLSEGMSRPVYRGQANASWQLQSGALRRLQDAHGEDLPSEENALRKIVDRYHKEQLVMPMQVIDGDTLSDLQRLSVLQHQGAATGLLDFTELPLVALWFACAEWNDKDGKIFVLDIGDHQVVQNARLMDDPFSALSYYEPDRSLGARIIAQQSVFVIGTPLVPEQYLKSVIVPRQSKEPLREYLKGLGLSETVLFGDIPGLAAANTARTKLQSTGPLSPEQYRDRGNRAYQAGLFDDALAAYESYAAELPGVAQPNCLKGDTLAALGRFEEANLAYTSAIENLDRPIYFGDHVIVTQDVADMMSRALYYNRGNVRAATGDHQGAIADFDVALEHGAQPKRVLLYNRGNSKFALGAFDEALKDFEAAWLEQEGSDAALAMGNCEVMMGAFKEALQRYLEGSTVEPKPSATHCRNNAEQVQQLLQRLTGDDCPVRRDGLIVFVEAEGAGGHFPFAGNSGNTGNIPSGMVTAPGGKGYKGATGFVVVIVSPTP